MEGRITYPAGRYQGRLLPHTGRHTLAGILIAVGPPFTPGEKQEGARLMDLAPTILYLSGLPVPMEMDGEPLMGWLRPSYHREHPVEWEMSQGVERAKEAEATYDQREAAAVEARLRDLGYIG